MNFDSIKLGAVATSEHKVTEADVNDFVKLSGDDNKLHVDSGFAEETKFKGVVAHGMLGMSFISKVIGTQLPGDGALWYSQNIEFLLPARIGDRLLVRVEVVGKCARERVIELKTEIFNQHKQRITNGVGKVRVVEPRTPSAETCEKSERKLLSFLGEVGVLALLLAAPFQEMDTKWSSITTREAITRLN